LTRAIPDIGLSNLKNIIIIILNKIDIKQLSSREILGKIFLNKTPRKKCLELFIYNYLHGSDIKCSIKKRAASSLNFPIGKIETAAA
jgi:hypothetical protein